MVNNDPYDGLGGRVFVRHSVSSILTHLLHQGTIRYGISHPRLDLQYLEIRGEGNVLYNPKGEDGHNLLSQCSEIITGGGEVDDFRTGQI